MDKFVNIIGAGLAGSEAALQLAQRGVHVRLFEMRPETETDVHRGGDCAELVCSNSLKSTKPESAAGMLKAELAALGSQLIAAAGRCRVDAGGALAVDRDEFSADVTSMVKESPYIEYRVMCVSDPLDACLGAADATILATGPLTSDALAQWLVDKTGSDNLAFFDAAAPIVDASTLDMDVLFSQSRYEEQGSGDYLNAPLNKEEYEAFIEALTTADRVVLKDFEGGDLFQACQPAEEVARTGKDAIRFGAMKPVGLTDPRTGRRPWAAIQLRAENKEKTAYNLVGFQTNLTFGEQKRVFHMVPGLENAEFFRYGVMHRNTFVDAPHVLDSTFAVPGTGVRLAGQITGTEGYMEAVATGLLAALNTYAEAIGAAGVELPRVGALGALVGYATDPATVGYQPMHVNFGLVPPLEDGKRRSKRDRYQAYADRALEALDAYLATRSDLFGGDRS